MKKHITIMLSAGLFLLGVLQTATAQNLQITLTASNYNGFNISCFGAQDGSITAIATGGTPPYIFTWSTNESTQGITNVAAGYYRCHIKDSNNTQLDADITLTEPEQLILTPELYLYPNNYNISLYGSCNGIISLIATGGATTYSYLWDDNVATQNRSALCSGNHFVILTDANGCTIQSEQLYLQQPDRSDWTMTGNTGSNPTTNFMGTTDSVDFSLRTNNAERLKINSNGSLKLSSMTGSSYDMLFIDSLGNVLRNAPQNSPSSVIAWMTNGNSPLNSNSYLGTPIGVQSALRFCTNGVERMKFTSDGRIGVNYSTPSTGVTMHIFRGFIGTAANAALMLETNHSTNDNGNCLQIKCDNSTTNAIVVTDFSGSPTINFKVKANGNVYAREVTVQTGPFFPDYVFKKGYQFLSIDELENYVATYNHLPGLPAAAEVITNGIPLGKMQVNLTEKVEELTLYIIEFNNRLKKLEAENVQLKNVNGKHK